MDKTAETVETAKTFLDYAEQLGPTFVAIVAIIVTFLIARRQILATTTSISRRQWIDSLRDGLSELLSARLLTTTALDNKHLSDLFEKFAVSDTRVQLLLDPSDTVHFALLEALFAFCKLVQDAGPDLSKTEAVIARICNARQEVIDKSRAVIAAEWSRLKQGR